MTTDGQPEADTTAIFRHRIRQTIATAREKNLTDDTTTTEPTEESLMSTAREFLAAVQQRADAATDGPWSVYNRGVGHEVHWSGAHDDGVAFKASLFSDDATRRSDAEFIAASRTDVPRLVAALTAALDAHEPVNALLNPGPHERVVKVCTGCGTDDGNWQRWPCPTVRVITAALTPKENDS